MKSALEDHEEFFIILSVVGDPEYKRRIRQLSATYLEVTDIDAKRLCERSLWETEKFCRRRGRIRMLGRIRFLIDPDIAISLITCCQCQ